MEPVVRWIIVVARSRKLALGAVLLIVTNVAPAHSDEPRPRVEWKCIQERDELFHVACLARPDRGDPTAFELLLGDLIGTATAAPASVPARASRAADLRPVVDRGAAAVFAPGAWRVPLHGPPSDTAAVIRLLRIVLCGSAPDCAVSYER